MLEGEFRLRDGQWGLAGSGAGFSSLILGTCSLMREVYVHAALALDFSSF